MDLRRQLIEFEGWEHEAYPDPLTHSDPWTIGVGATGPGIVKGVVWTDEQIGQRLDADIAEKTARVRRAYPLLDELNEPRQAVLIGMQFQLKGGIAAWPKLLASIRNGRFEEAAENIRQSRWARQTPKRAIRLASQLESGAWN